ncbi:Levansucrase and sucrase synthesis operon antiterminator [Lentibacillus sp. JNUCC-1]|uniref:PRD domain-containing protein n=1 Tax=Lentibacillus sp. JNUCC-1 TaxID=2654513 RepID=UPI0012E8CC7E|nr:PRD domain-containing protein [Lentibacillus sp. JNUCC-1]MUV36395.1 Levansucrase and sucrase synthesis operon antiterminator [Lentibacillus sp. JNUCC-1]
MKIRKILNNNAVIVMDNDQEKIAMGPGVGFNKHKNDILPQSTVEKLFVLKEHEKLQQLLERIPEEHLILAEDIIKHAEQELGMKINEHILIMLTDHVSFAIERLKEGIRVNNKLLQEIKILYKEEFNIALWAIRHIEEKTGVKMPLDEAGFIALHIHTMKLKGGDVRKAVRQTTIVREMVDSIESCLSITIEENDIAYERLIMHLHFALTRTNQYNNHTMDPEMLEMIKSKYQISFQCAQTIAENIALDHNIYLPEEELGYITLHIERLRQN